METPIQDDRLRTLFIADDTHRILALGAGYEWSKGLHVDMAVSRSFYEKTPFNNTEPAFGHTLVGHYYNGKVDMVGIQLRREY